MTYNKTPIDLNDLKDFMGNHIYVGAKIVYAATVGRSARLTLGEVLAISHQKDKYSPSGFDEATLSIKVDPKQDSWGGRDNFDYSKDPITGQFTRTPKPAKPVYLHFTDRLLVLK